MFYPATDKAYSKSLSEENEWEATKEHSKMENEWEAEKLPKNTVKWRTDYSFREENVLIMIRGAFTDWVFK